jgi:hypothetical protein
MSLNKKTRKARKQKGGSLMTFILGAGVGGLLTSLFSGDSGSTRSSSSGYGSLMSHGGGKRKTRVKRKNSKTKKNRK